MTRVQRSQADFPPPTPQKTLCRLWQGAVDGDGYAIFSRKHHGVTKRKRVYRWVWEQKNGPIPDGLVVRHKCDNRVCYRLSHLELGTVADNNRDAAERQHLGPVRVLSPSQIRAIWARHEAGESLRQIHRDYPEVSLATVKRAKDYITECLELNTDSPTDEPTTRPTDWAAAAETAPSPTPVTPADDAATPKMTPPTTPG